MRENKRYKQSEQKSTELSNAKESLPLTNKQKREALLKQLSSNIINESKRSID